ncbi:MAG TPA: aspartate--tRNA(Asn) ligase [Nitrososphaeraceae archaeon]|nr:aspartate--tRNA(Asn) ligase [Nitrososphaeraceae archaeon]
MIRSHLADCITDDLVDKDISVAGWIEDIRDIGRLGFVSMRDFTGIIQIIVDGDLLGQIRTIPRQSCVLIVGKVQRSKAKNVNFEIKASKISLLSKAIHPLPIDPTGRVESSTDKRIDSRALDLRDPKVSAIFRLRSSALQTIRDFLRSKRFTEVTTPKIIGTSTEGGANLFRCDYFGKDAYLAQSPQLYKEQLTVGLERVFEIGPYFRAEKSHTVRHLAEFTSVDVEAAFLDYTDVMEIVADLMRRVINDLMEFHGADLKMTRQKSAEPHSVANRVQDEAVPEMKEIFGISNDIRLDASELKIDRITYEEAIDELRGQGESLSFGDDLSDTALRKLGDLHKGFYFITDWPMRLKPFYIHEKEGNQELSCSFDLQFGYLELVSGGRRQHDPYKLKNKIMEQGLDPSGFEDHLKAFQWGMPPHSGWGLGFDRLMMVLTNSQNVREVVLYPRDAERLRP